MKYRVVKSVDLGEDGPQVGELWAACERPDYGLRSDHERFTGEAHVNLSRTGDYPFFTVPRSSVEPL